MNESYIHSDITEIIDGIRSEIPLFAGKSLLITGGNGFLGRYFTAIFKQLNANELKDNPTKLFVIDNFKTSRKDLVETSPNITFLEYDVIKPLKKVPRKIDMVLHMAGIASPYYYRAFPLETLQVAVEGTKNLLDLAHKKNARFIFFSSSEIYGDPDPKYVPTPESYRGNVSCLGPRACYDESKRAGETLCYIYHTQFNTHTNIIRPFNVYGPGMQERDYRILPNFASRIKGNKPLHIYGSGKQTRTFCYIVDAIVGYLKVVVKGVPGEPYNIGHPSPEISMLDLKKTIEQLLDLPIKQELIDYPDSYPGDEPNRRCPDITKAILQLEFKPEISLEDGLERFFRWAIPYYTGEQ